MYTCGVDSSLTGMGAKFLIIDDPHKSMAEAESATMRDAVYQWFLCVARTRLRLMAASSLIQTRWHHDDLAGRLLRDAKDGGDQWDVISLPAIAEEDNDVIGASLGWHSGPTSSIRNALAQTKAAVGSRVWISLYQQRPSL